MICAVSWLWEMPRLWLSLGSYGHEEIFAALLERRAPLSVQAKQQAPRSIDKALVVPSRPVKKESWLYLTNRYSNLVFHCFLTQLSSKH